MFDKLFASRFPAMNEVEDDSWVREFDVSNPQKTYAGYTVYRVSSKVYPKGFPEGASEVIVFKRYSEIRALYKELKIIYESKNAEKKKFPRFAKGHYFDRFDESVIEERQKQALSLLLFAGNISFLFTSQPFATFFEGGVEHSSRGSSYNSSDSEQHTDNTNNETQPWTPEMYFSEKQDSSDDETIYEITRDLPNTHLSLNIKKTSDEDDKTWLSRAMSLCSEGDDIEALASQAGYIASNVKDNSLIPQEEDGDSVLKIDTLPSQGSVDMLPTLLESDEGEDEEDVFVEILSSRKSNEIISPDNSEILSPRKLDNPEEVSGLRGETECELSRPLDTQLKSASSSQDNVDSLGEDVQTDQDLDFVSSTMKLNDRTDESSEDKETSDDDKERDSDIKETGNKNASSSAECTKPAQRQVGRTVSNIAMSWIDPKKKDYLYQAAQIIQQALYCEANEMYEEAFNKYKICVGILLNGVQDDSDGKRREAVRRKTAQYLVKAEFLFNTYLKHDDKDISNWSIKPQSSAQDITDRNIVDRQFGHLTLASLKVIGVIGKNMLVQCEGLDGVYVIKALHKTNAVHRSSRQENKQTSRSFSKKYVRSSYMVKLHRHFDSNDSIFLLLDYAAGGCLWSHVKTSKQHYCQDTSSQLPDENVGLSNDTSGISERTSGISERTSGQHKHTFDVAADTSGFRTETSVEETGPEMYRDEGGNSKEVVGNRFSGEQILNPLIGSSNSERNILNSSNELGSRKGGTLSSSNYTSTESKTDMTPTCLTGQKTCLNPDKTSLEDIKNDGSGQTCQTTCGDVLGFLDHVTKDYSAMGKCVQYWVAELLLAINSVHSCGIILKDLKPSNVLLDGNGRVKLSYFGVWEEVDHSVDPEAMTQLYCAPEISRGEKITFAADWWSLGVLSYELITGKTLCSTHPWGIYPHSSIIFPSQDISTEARSFLSGLICHNSRERLGSALDGVEGIKSHAFFQGVDWNELAKSS